MKKYILITYILTFCAGIISSCQEEMATTVKGDNVITIQLSNKTLNVSTTRAENDNISILNEDKIVTANVFFFESETSVCAYSQLGVSAIDGGKLQFPVDPEMIGEDYLIYIVANYRWENEDLSGKTLSDLKAKLIETTFNEGDEAEDSFVMQGQDMKTIVAEGEIGPVQLTRLASKISLYVNAKPFEEGGITYTPDYTGMKVRMFNRVQKTKLDGSYVPVEGDFSASIRRSFAKGKDGTGEEGQLSHIPFYSYSNDWNTEGAQNESYLELCLPWSHGSEEGQVIENYYYLVPIGKKKKLESNMLYRINVTVGILGGSDPDEMTELEGEFEIKDWSEALVNGDINRYHYLTLETKYLELKNEDKADIYFASSSVVTAEVISVTYPDYSKVEVTEGTDDIDDYKVEVFGQTLMFEHALQEGAFAPRTITIRLTNRDGMTEDLVIVQYPDIYIEADHNSDGRNNCFLYGLKHSDPGLKQAKSDDGVDLGDLFYNAMGDGSSDRNPNQYNIYVSALDATSTYVIGDPRTSIPELTSSFRKFGGLDYYYPAQKENVNSTIAPAFKVASSWGGFSFGGIEFNRAKYRCAAYQENGYPAGRWRLPTEAEIRYTVDLSEKGFIPTLFAPNDYYWASSGKAYHNGNFSSTVGGSSNQAYVRCVYDVWYWGDEKIDNPEQFAWGDEERK